MVMLRKSIPIVMTKGQHKMFQHGPAFALWISLMVGRPILSIILIDWRTKDNKGKSMQSHNNPQQLQWMLNDAASPSKNDLFDLFVQRVFHAIRIENRHWSGTRVPWRFFVITYKSENNAREF